MKPITFEETQELLEIYNDCYILSKDDLDKVNEMYALGYNYVQVDNYIYHLVKEIEAQLADKFADDKAVSDYYGGGQ